ncbi:hypothetical protein TeGR_g3082, partial [Tetraparma gracilis]
MDSTTLACSVLIISFLLFAVRVDSRFNPLHRPARYTRARTVNWLLLGLLYISYYVGRYNLSVVNNEYVRSSLGATKESYGLVLTLGHFSYAVFMLVNGNVADRIGGKKAILIGAVGSACVNAASAVMFYVRQHTIMSLTFFNVVNMMFQPMGSLCVVRINTNWYDRKERGVFSGVFGVTIGLGTFAAFVGSGAIIAEFPFYYIFAKGAVLLLFTAGIVALFVSESPSPSLSDDSDPSEADPAIPAPAAASKKDTAFAASFARVVRIPAIRLLIVCICCTGWVREGLLSWYTSYLEEVHGVPVGSSLFTVTSTGITFGAMVGSLMGGFVSDRFFNSERVPAVLFFFCVEILAIAVFNQVDDVYVAISCICTVASCLFGSLTLIIGCAGADYAGLGDAGMASGVLNFSQYLASGLGSFAIGSMVERGGWGLWSVALLPAALMGAAASTLHSNPNMFSQTAQAAIRLSRVAPAARRFSGLSLPAAAASSGSDSRSGLTFAAFGLLALAGVAAAPARAENNPKQYGARDDEEEKVDAREAKRKAERRAN